MDTYSDLKKSVGIIYTKKYVNHISIVTQKVTEI